MKTVTVPAIADFRHHDRRYQSGDAVTCRPIEAAALARAGRVSLDRVEALLGRRRWAKVAALSGTEPVQTVISDTTPQTRRRRRKTQTPEADG